MENGIVNLVEYAAGLDPNYANASADLMGFRDLVETLTLQYSHDTTASDVILYVEYNDDLSGEWEDISTEGKVIGSDDGVETVQVEIITADNAESFYRLRVERIP
ncbi:MAG: hypothetical protein ACSHX0_04745 [Akkermansiaceae bacterium]